MIAEGDFLAPRLARIHSSGPILHNCKIGAAAQRVDGWSDLRPAVSRHVLRISSLTPAMLSLHFVRVARVGMMLVGSDARCCTTIISYVVALLLLSCFALFIFFSFFLFTSMLYVHEYVVNSYTYE